MSMPPQQDTVAAWSERLARCVLTFCIDGADALMTALLKGTPTAAQVVVQLSALLQEVSPVQAQHARDELTRMFIDGTTQWGGQLTPQGMKAFDRALARWQHRLATLPSWNTDELRDMFTMHDTQWVITPQDPWWPAHLDDLSLRADYAPPLCLWGRGDPQALITCDEPLGIVGSRGVKDYGRQVANELAYDAASHGHTIISGGAMGTDACAHWGALHAMDAVGSAQAGRTIAVFAGGLNHIGPACNMQLFDAICEHHGALISELCPTTIPEGRRFLLRNRIIAALCPILVVAQARLRSGALNTARWAADLNREIYAVPGMITAPDHAGCNALIRDHQAILLTQRDTTDWCHAAHLPIQVAPVTEQSQEESHTLVAAIPQDTMHPQHTEACEDIPHAIPDDPVCHGVLAAIRALQQAHIVITPTTLLDWIEQHDATMHPV